MGQGDTRIANSTKRVYYRNRVITQRSDQVLHLSASWKQTPAAKCCGGHKSQQTGAHREQSALSQVTSKYDASAR